MRSARGWKVWSYGLMAMLWRVHSMGIWLIGSHMTMATLADEPKFRAVGRDPNIDESIEEGLRVGNEACARWS